MRRKIMWHCFVFVSNFEKFFVTQYFIQTYSFHYCMTEIKEMASTFRSGRSGSFGYFFQQLNVSPLSVFLKTRFFLSYTLSCAQRPFHFHPNPRSGSFINASLILAVKRLVRPSIPREYTTLPNIPIFSSFISYLRRSLFGI